MKAVDLKSDMPSVPEALQRLDREICRSPASRSTPF